MLDPKSIDWKDPSSLISKHFRVKDALWLHRWGRLANETEDGLDDAIKANLVLIFSKLDLIQDIYNLKSFIITSAFRPVKYNEMIKGAKNSAHTYGMAIDFQVCGMSVSSVQMRLRPLLAQFDIRMEKTTKTWVHIDSREPKTPNDRFFIP